LVRHLYQGGELTAGSEPVFDDAAQQGRDSRESEQYAERKAGLLILSLTSG